MISVKLGLCQMHISESKQENLNKAVEMLNSCGENGVNIAVLPEMFNCPYETSKFSVYAEELEKSETVSVISASAKYNKMYIVAGSIPEICDGKIFNTCLVFEKSGNIIGKHRKMHLFDINIKNGICFRESDILSRGDQVTVFDTEFCKIGVAICFDMRFSELYGEMSKAGAKVIITPGAFNMTTGPAHWELLVRVRALDNQLFHVAVSPSRNTESSYVAYGNSMICDPWGNVLSRADEKEQIIFTEIDLDMVDTVRSQIPVVKPLNK